MKGRILIFFVFLLPFALTACMTDTPAPVVEGWQQPNAKSGFYRVQQGDTLYSIAWAYNLDYRALAMANQLTPPYRIYLGQTLRMTIMPPTITSPASEKLPVLVQKKSIPALPKRQPKFVQNKPYVAPWQPERLASRVERWNWPVKGRVVSRFSSALAGNKGVDIAGRYGQSVRASADGVVVYSGAGVRGYGNLIIVKHNNSYLSAYAFNKRILVREGSRVRAGQVIAEMGRDDAGRTMLHFEIRRDGKPVNPLQYLS